MKRRQPKNGEKGWYSRGYLPHLDWPTIQFITFRLADSLPSELLQRWKSELANSPEASRRAEEYRRVEAHVDRGSGACVLRNRLAARLVEAALIERHGVDFELHGWVVMPNHVHFLAGFREEAEIGQVMKQVKGKSARFANRVLNRSGSLWYREHYDRYIRDQDHFENAIGYLNRNPVKARLCGEIGKFEFSSARFLLRPVGSGLFERVPFGEMAEFVTAEFASEIEQLKTPTEVGGPSKSRTFMDFEEGDRLPTEVGGPSKGYSATREETRT